ncbi:hypothetical protein L1887_38186 [Cichorium endivia]|nr:hypothetical protein L1887_38186 [Cichorium endivia]
MRKILGVDIDSARIEDAYWNLRRIVKMNEQKKQNSTVDKSKDAGNDDKSYSFLSHSESLSVTKWVHLNWGDESLIALFSKVWKLLQPGGVFILEPQPWKSYVSNCQVSEPSLVFMSPVAATNYKNLEIFPERFQEILLDKIRFREIENLSASLSGSKSGFNRPVLANLKCCWLF